MTIENIINFLISGISGAGFVWFFLKCRDQKREIKFLRDLLHKSGHNEVHVFLEKAKHDDGME